MADLVVRARAVTRAAGAAGAEARWTEGAARLDRTVVRPLVALGVLEERTLHDRSRHDPAVCDEPASPTARAVSTAILELAEAVVAACGEDSRPELLEACAGVLRLVADDAEPERADEVARVWARAASIPAGPCGRVTVATDGPYLVVGPAATKLDSWLGEPLDPPPVVALCRCGGSASKPWCDGRHAENGFSGAKRADRVPDALEVYQARQFAITDNRGLCAHSARCSDAVPTVFRTGTEPFVAPAGGRADDILRAVQACPSGALGAALEGRRADELADTRRDPMIEVSKDGPYRLTGGIEVLDPEGAPVPRPTGASPEHASLCRCGHSSNKPFCSGAHWYTDFTDPVVDPGAEPTLFAWAGGYPALLRMTTLFYERHVPTDDLLAPLFARMEPDHPDRVACWLSEVFGGPDLYSRRFGGYSRMISQHIGKHLREDQRARWVALLARSADEAGLPTDPEFRAAFTAYLEWGSRIAVENSGDGAQPPRGMPVPRWWWVCNATPAARPSAQPAAAPDPTPGFETPAPDDAVSFERHVRGLFRSPDRGSMRFVFDLWSVDDVREHADAILARLRNGSMPCDGAWPAEKIDVFVRWVESGTSA